MGYRTRTYIAGDWTGDQDLISKLYEWNDNNNLKLHFIDAHDLTQARDTSLYCSIKKSLSERLDVSKTFILVVGSNTAKLTKGSCKYCQSRLVVGIEGNARLARPSTGEKPKSPEAAEKARILPLLC